MESAPAAARATADVASRCARARRRIDSGGHDRRQGALVGRRRRRAPLAQRGGAVLQEYDLIGGARHSDLDGVPDTRCSTHQFADAPQDRRVLPIDEAQFRRYCLRPFGACRHCRVRAQSTMRASSDGRLRGAAAARLCSRWPQARFIAATCKMLAAARLLKVQPSRPSPRSSSSSAAHQPQQYAILNTDIGAAGVFRTRATGVVLRRHSTRTTQVVRRLRRRHDAVGQAVLCGFLVRRRAHLPQHRRRVRARRRNAEATTSRSRRPSSTRRR